MPQQLTAFGGELHHAFGVTRRHASRVFYERISLREGPIADDIRPYGPYNSTTYGGADLMVLRTIIHLAFGEIDVVR